MSQFGSIDYNGKQVDDGTYRLRDARTVRINDGTFTQIEGRNVTDGMKVIAGTVSTTQTAQTSTAAGSSPFGSNGQQQRGQRPGGF